MRRDAGHRDGFTLIELLMVIIIIGVLASLALAGYRRARQAAELAAAAAELRHVYTQFQSFYVSNGMYPNATSNPSFQLDTFDPLDYGMGVQRRLVGGQADAYDSPDDRGTNQEFWVTMTLALDTDTQLIVASSDNCPLAPGQWLEGIYLYRNGQLSKTFGAQ